MRKFLSMLALVACLGLVACDVGQVFQPDESGQSQAQEVVEDVRPLVPPGLPRLILDGVAVGLAIYSTIRARKTDKALREYDESEFDLEEAESMMAAMDHARSLAARAKDSPSA